MKQNQTITELIEACTGYFEQNCYTKHRIEQYKSMWRNGICHYMKKSGITNYNCSIGEEFIRDNISARVTPGERDLIRSVTVLNEMQASGKVSKKTVHPITRKLTGEIGEAAERFLHRLKELRRNATTMQRPPAVPAPV